MKRLFLLQTLFFLFFLTNHVQSQTGFCENFNNGGIGNWTVLNGFVNNFSDRLQGSDDSGTSWLINTGYNYETLGCGEICYDYRILEDGYHHSNPDVFLQIRIFRGNVYGAGSVNATFRLQIPVHEDEPWRRVCVPLAFVNPLNPLPFNQSGHWEMNIPATSGNWNDLMEHFDGVAFNIDMAESGATEEILEIDNFCFTAQNCCASTPPSGNFTLSTNCNSGEYIVNVSGFDPNASHTWRLFQTQFPDETTSGTQVGPAQTGLSAVFNGLNKRNYYYVVHRISRLGCVTQEVKVVPYHQLENYFHFENESGVRCTTFCYGNDIFLNGAASYGENNYFIGIMRRPLSPANQPYEYYDQRWWAGTPIGLINLSALFANEETVSDPNGTPNGIKYFEPGYEYKVGVALQNTAECVNWVLEEKTFTVECCTTDPVSAYFELDRSPIQGSNDINLEAVFYEHYENYGSVKHSWTLLGSPNQSGGPYSVIMQVSGAVFNVNVPSGQTYTLIHHIESSCGDFCYGQNDCTEECEFCGEVDCSILDGICTTAPANLVSKCLPFWPTPAERLDWDPVSGATGGYFVEVTYNDPACCESEYSTLTTTYKVNTDHLDINTVQQPLWDCLRWRVAAVCGSEIRIWSEYQCFEGCGRSAGGRSNENSILKNEAFISPNPADRLVEIRFESPFTGTISLTDALGRVVSTVEITDQSVSRFDLQNLLAGIYQISTQNAAQRKVYQLVKQ